MSTIYIPYPSAPLPIVFTDNFNRGAGLSVTLGSNWSVESGGPIVNNNFARGQGTGRAFVSTSVGSFGQKQYVQYKPYTYRNGGTYNWWLRGGSVRMACPSITNALLSLRVYNSNQFDTGIVPSLFDTIRLEVDGTNFSIKRNGNVVWTGTLTTSPDPGQPGFSCSLNMDIDDFEAGET